MQMWRKRSKIVVSARPSNIIPRNLQQKIKKLEKQLLHCYIFSLLRKIRIIYSIKFIELLLKNGYYTDCFHEIQKTPTNHPHKTFFKENNS